MSETDYFSARGVDESYYTQYNIPKHLQLILPENKNAPILDIGCGFGQFLLNLKNQGYMSLSGVDVSESAVKACLAAGLKAERITDESPQALENYITSISGEFDLITMMHVLEHTPKTKVIFLLKQLRSKLKTNGWLYITVPNAQSNTGPYWAYEDWTHETLFTAGSLLHVLRAAGFQRIEFLDPQCLLEVSTPFKRLFKRVFLKVYDFKINFWNRVTHSFFHGPSPRIYSYEIKVRAS